jgi:hypothetical protein
MVKTVAGEKNGSFGRGGIGREQPVCHHEVNDLGENL